MYAFMDKVDDEHYSLQSDFQSELFSFYYNQLFAIVTMATNPP